MSTQQAPDSCPFCGAGFQDEGILQWKCGTGWATTDPRDDQSHKCANTERERLTRERDGARELAEAGSRCIADMARSNLDLLARVKRLEEAGDGLQSAVIGEEGMSHWQWLALAHEADLKWRKAKEAKP